MNGPSGKPNGPGDSSAGLGFIYAGMIAVGALLATLCGGCTLYFAGTTLWRTLTGHVGSEGVPWVLTGLVFGGLPTIGGAVLVIEGLKGLRRRKLPPQGPKPPPSDPPPG